MNNTQNQTEPTAPRTPTTSPRTKEANRLRAEADGAILPPAKRNSLFSPNREAAISTHIEEGLAQHDQRQAQQPQ